MVVILFSETVTVPQSDDSKSGAREDLSVFRTSTAELKIGNTTFPHYFGQLATFGDPANMFRVHFTDSNDFRAVSGGEGTWEQFWTDKGSNDSNDYTVWKVKASAIPHGFKCLSPFFFFKAKGRPAPTDAQVQGMVFVADRLCEMVDGRNYTVGWNDRGTWANKDVSMAFSKDNVGYLAFQESSPPPTYIGYTLNFSLDEVKLVQTWSQLADSIKASAYTSLFPLRVRVDSHVLSMSKSGLTEVFDGNTSNFRKYKNNTYDCEDFAAEMRAAVARNCHDDPVPSGLEVGCFCGMAYLMPNDPTKAGHGKNIYLQADGTCAMFEPQNGEFETVSECLNKYNFEGVYY